MAERRTEIMVFTGTMATLGYAAAALLATVGKQELSSPWFVLSTVVAVVCNAAFVVAGLAPLARWLSRMLRERGRPGQLAQPPTEPVVEPLIIDRWLYTTDGSRVPALTVVMEIGLPSAVEKLVFDLGLDPSNPGVNSHPWVRFVATMACSEISPDDDPDLHFLCFEALLTELPVTMMIRELTAVPEHASWRRSSATSPGVMDAVLADFGSESPEVATARLELPGGGRRYGRDACCATMMLHIEPRSQDGSFAGPQPPEFWEAGIQHALSLPESLAKMLADLGLRTSGDPPAKVGVRLEATRDIAEMVDITGLHPMRGSVRGSQAIGFFIAEREGKSAEQAAATMVRDMLLYALKTSDL